MDKQTTRSKSPKLTNTFAEGIPEIPGEIPERNSWTPMKDFWTARASGKPARSA